MGSRDEDCAKFKRLAAQIGSLFTKRTEGDRKLIEKTLDELLQLDYRYPIVEIHSNAVLLVNNCCCFIPADESSLVTRCCHLIKLLVASQKVCVGGRTQTVAVEWCLQVLERTDDDSLATTVLSALDALLNSNRDSAKNFIFDILAPTGPVVNLANHGRSLEIIGYALKCMDVCIIPTDDKSKSYFDMCEQIILKYLTDPKDVTDNTQLKIIVVCLRSLEKIVSTQPIKSVSANVGVILGVTKSYMSLGLKKHEFYKPQELLPSRLSIAEPPANNYHTNKKKKERVVKLHKKGSKRDEPESRDLVEDFMSPVASQQWTSDSDYSDNETTKGENSFRLQSKIRERSLMVLLIVAEKLNRSTLFSYWSSFLPENPISGQNYLSTCLLDDPSPRNRSAILNVLVKFLTSSKFYLSQAEFSEKTTAFTSFSVTLGYVIVELHRHLALALNEKIVPILAQVLKCYAALVEASPYHKLQAGLVTKVVRNMRVLIYHKDNTIQVGALLVLRCLLNAELPTNEARNVLLKNQSTVDDLPAPTHGKADSQSDDCYVDFQSDEDDEVPLDQVSMDVPWIVARCLGNLDVLPQTDQVSAAVKLETVQVVSAMCKNYFGDLVYAQLALIAKALDACLSDKYRDLRLAAVRAAEQVGLSLNLYLKERGDEKITLGVSFWMTLIAGSLTVLLQSEGDSLLKTLSCNCLASIGPNVFQSLPSDKQILCITLLFACSRDEDASVRGAAVRALGFAVLYPTLREDPGFVVDTAETLLRAMQDEDVAVKIKASWSLAKLSDAVALNRFTDDIEELPHSLLLKLLEKCVCSCDEDVGVQANMVRGLGNLLQLIDRDIARKAEFRKLFRAAVECLLKSATTGSLTKVRWNACYAIGNVLKNQTTYTDSSELLAKIFNSLSDLVVNYHNFKVRTSAALALSSPLKRKNYGNHYQTVWISLLKSLDNCRTIDDFTGYQHRDHLIEQLCLALAHLITLLQTEDLPLLRDSLHLYHDVFKTEVKRLQDILLPEKSGVLLEAGGRLKTISGSRGEELTMLKDIFVQNSM